MSINSMIDSVCRCVKCGATLRDGCDCWVKMKCPVCGKTKTVSREKSDLPGTAVVCCPCPECDIDTFSISYFDKQGKQIFG
jgi:hypothetical protein